MYRHQLFHQLQQKVRLNVHKSYLLYIKFFLGDDASIYDESSSDDERSINDRFNRKSLPNKGISRKIKTFNLIFDFLAVPNNRFSNVNQFEQLNETIYGMTDHERDDSIDSFKTDERSSKGIDKYLLRTIWIN